MDLFNIKGKVVVVTGGMGQLGSNFVKYLLANEAKTVILDIITDQKLIEEKFGSDKESLLALNCDITSKKEIEKALAQIKQEFGQPFGLINNAALDSPPDSSSADNGPFETFPEDSWDKVMEVNSKGVFLMSQVIGGEMAKYGAGSIINISSIYGLVSPNQSIYDYRRVDNEDFYKPVAYSASKSSLLNLTRYLATYWAKKGVRVNNLILGGVYNSQDEEFLESYNNLIPIGRMANEDEYNGAILFLLSDASSYMTGSNLTLDGGWTAW